MLTKQSLKGAVEIAKSIVELKGKYPNDYKNRYKPNIYPLLKNYESKNKKTPNRLFHEELKNIDYKNLFDSQGFTFLGDWKEINERVWATLKIKLNGNYKIQPQLFINANAQCIRFGIGYGNTVDNDNPFVEKVRNNKNIQFEILKVLKSEGRIKFFNTKKTEFLPPPKSEIKLNSFTDIENYWEANSKLMGVITYREINNNSGEIINKCLKELYNLFQMICLDNISITDVEYEYADTEKQIEALEKKYKDATPEVVYKLVKTIERGSISKEIKKVYGYKCLVCEALSGKTVSFKKKKGDKEDEGDTYIETHHVIEVYKLIKGTLGVSNLITVCANHHRQFHFGNIEIKVNTKDILKLKIDGKEIAIKKIKL
jgi:hypothetical protein